ncbi:thiamine biosynthesis protein MoeB [Terrilactibacillus sp. BCM23-1]|uniref:Thiamine biosynthesis protein MoeB n=1 Tax=Terrilactibacillus tamarindi TaxID=2599694 RepID=A0A6N8CUM0_9BACI|nr:MoeB/ThiF family adenylyltransferase [Terrilactibacillus tamarindi]MTT31836.1 thiamine biosynthesis protein MoeB [Terrilactibacillus tamarindi]
MKDRYSRQTMFSAIGEKGQRNIQKKKVLIIGAGALGTANAELLTRAGVGQLTIVDRDYVEWSNLQRQQLYVERDAHDQTPKAIAIKKHLTAINHEVSIVACIKDVNASNLEAMAEGHDLMIDATDNFETRWIINDISQKLSIPWIYGACVGSFGMSFTVIPGKTPCMNCLWKSIPFQSMTCETGGIIAPAVQMVTAHQTAEALKILAEDWTAIRTTFVSFDLWNNQFQSIDMTKAKREDCLSCGKERTYPFLDVTNGMKTMVLCGRETVQVRPPKPVNLNINHLLSRLKKAGYEAQANPYLVQVHYEKERMVLFKDGRALIHGTNDIAYAKRVYQKILG